jgi:hypothetical protein
MQTREVLDSVVRVLSPYLGATMARASAHAHCQRLGIGDGEISRDQVEQLVGKIAHGLAVFVGREKSVVIADEIRKAVGLSGAQA